MGWQIVKIGDFLKRSKIPINIDDSKFYNRVTIRIKHQGVSLRDTEIGKKIGTKKQFILKAGQFVMSKIDARYGAFGIAPDEVEGAIITGNFWAYDVEKSIVNINWLNQYTNSPVFYNLCERASSGITHRKYLDEKSFLNHQILLPEITEQDAHVAFIGARKESVSNIEDEISFQLDLLKKLRQQILQDAVQGKLVPQDASDEPASVLLKRIKAEKEQLIREKKIKKEKPLPTIKKEEIPFEIPENWVWCRLGEICLKITDGFHNTPPKTLTGFPYIAATHVKSDKIDWANCHFVAEQYHRELFIKTYPVKGELLLVNIGAGCGTPAIIDIDYEFSFKNTAILKFNQSLIYNKFLFFFFFLRKDQIYSELTKGGLQPFLSLKILNEIYFPLPTYDEQYRIVSKIEQLMRFCDELEQTIRQNQTYTRQLLQVALKEALEPSGTRPNES
ncbi:MAG: restriction endonuclease subunit S [Bacteroidales bacterium]